MADQEVRSPNFIPALLAQDSLDTRNTVALYADKTTHRLLVDAISTDAAPTTIFNGKKTVTTAGTSVALASTQDVVSVSIKALSGNTGIIYVGGSGVSSSNGLQLAAGEAVSLDIADLATIHIDSSVNGEGVTYLAVN